MATTGVPLGASKTVALASGSRLGRSWARSGRPGGSEGASERFGDRFGSTFGPLRVHFWRPKRSEKGFHEGFRARFLNLSQKFSNILENKLFLQVRLGLIGFGLSWRWVEEGWVEVGVGVWGWSWGWIWSWVERSWVELS